MSGLVPKILLGSACFNEWFRTLPGMYAAEKALIDLFREDLLDGLEIHVSFQDLPIWTEQLKAGKKILPGRYSTFGEDFNSAIFTKKHHTVHLEDLKNLPDGSEKWLGQQLSIIYEKLGISEFTIHPDEVQGARWRAVTANLPAKLTISVENMDTRKKSHRSLREMDELLKSSGELKFVFDICHYIENGYDLNDSELNNFVMRYFHRISRIHFSVPSTNSKMYVEGDRAAWCHFFWHDSDFTIPTELIQSLPKRISYVIEGVIPENGIDGLRREIGLLRSVLMPASEIPQLPTGTFG